MGERTVGPRSAHRAEVVLVGGTSANVWPPIAVALEGQRSGGFLIDVNPEATHLSIQADVHLEGPAGEVLPELRDAVLARRGPLPD